VALGQYLTATVDELRGVHRLRVWRLSGEPAAALAVATEAARAYIGDRALAARPDIALAGVLPDDPRDRHGDLGELLAAALYRDRHRSTVPIQKLRLKFIRREALPGPDVLVARIGTAGDAHTVAVEVKARSTPVTNGLVREAVKSLRSGLVTLDDATRTLLNLAHREGEPLEAIQRFGDLLAPRSLRPALVFVGHGLSERALDDLETIWPEAWGAAEIDVILVEDLKALAGAAADALAALHYRDIARVPARDPQRRDRLPGRPAERLVALVEGAGTAADAARLATELEAHACRHRAYGLAAAAAWAVAGYEANARILLTRHRQPHPGQSDDDSGGVLAAAAALIDGLRDPPPSLPEHPELTAAMRRVRAYHRSGDDTELADALASMDRACVELDRHGHAYDAYALHLAVAVSRRHVRSSPWRVIPPQQRPPGGALERAIRYHTTRASHPVRSLWPAQRDAVAAGVLDPGQRRRRPHAHQRRQDPARRPARCRRPRHWPRCRRRLPRPLQSAGSPKRSRTRGPRPGRRRGGHRRRLPRLQRGGEHRLAASAHHRHHPREVRHDAPCGASQPRPRLPATTPIPPPGAGRGTGSLRRPGPHRPRPQRGRLRTRRTASRAAGVAIRGHRIGRTRRHGHPGPASRPDGDAGRWAPRVATVIVDEAHLLDAEGRGARLELILSHILRTNPTVRIVLLSSQTPNVEELGAWLSNRPDGPPGEARTFTTSWRPTLLSRAVFFPDADDGVGRYRREDGYTEDLIALDPHRTASADLFSEGRPHPERAGHAGLVAALVAVRHQHADTAGTGAAGLTLVYGATVPDTRRLYEAVAAHPARLGVELHHGGLPDEERRAVEDAARRGELDVVCCTSTLAEGVNLPVRTVVVATRKWGGTHVPRSTLANLEGRAGRAFQYADGEAIYVCADDGDAQRTQRSWLAEPTPTRTGLSVLLDGLADARTSREIADHLEQFDPLLWLLIEEAADEDTSAWAERLLSTTLWGARASRTQRLRVAYLLRSRRTELSGRLTGQPLLRAAYLRSALSVTSCDAITGYYRIARCGTRSVAAAYDAIYDGTDPEPPWRVLAPVVLGAAFRTRELVLAARTAGGAPPDQAEAAVGAWMRGDPQPCDARWWPELRAKVVPGTLPWCVAAALELLVAAMGDDPDSYAARRLEALPTMASAGVPGPVEAAAVQIGAERHEALALAPWYPDWPADPRTVRLWFVTGPFSAVPAAVVRTAFAVAARTRLAPINPPDLDALKSDQPVTWPHVTTGDEHRRCSPRSW
jgi:hypothetical protein